LIWDLFGIEVIENNRKNRAQYHLHKRVEGGLIISKINPKSFLGQTGLQPGHIIYRIGQFRIDSLKDFRDIVMKISGYESVIVYLYIEGERYKVGVPLN